MKPNGEFKKVGRLAPELERDVRQLCLPQGRVVGTAGHRVAREHLGNRLREVGCEPYAGDDFALSCFTEGQDFINLVGVVPGRDRNLAPLLVAGHYDSVIEAPCADDNGAAVAICLALAEALVGIGGLERDVIIALFDSEEPPYFSTQAMGSHLFYHRQMDARGIHTAIVYDLVGHDICMPTSMIPGVGGLLGKIPGVRDSDMRVPRFHGTLFMTGAESHPDLAGMVGDTPLPRNLHLMATLNVNVGDMSDHGVFRKNGVPFLFFSCGRWAHYHMPSDVPGRLNYKKMARIAAYTFALLKKLDGEALSGRHSTFQPCDTTDFEAQTIKDTAGPFYSMMLNWAGLEELKTREELDTLVYNLMSTGL